MRIKRFKELPIVLTIGLLPWLSVLPCRAQPAAQPEKPSPLTPTPGQEKEQYGPKSPRPEQKSCGRRLISTTSA